MTDELRSLRLRLTGWYVAVFGLILLALGTALYVIAARQIVARMDASLVAALDALELELAAGGSPETVFERLLIPDRNLFLLAEGGAPIAPAEAPAWVTSAAIGLADGQVRVFTYEPDEVTGIDDADGDGEDDPDWRVAARVISVSGTAGATNYVAVATTTELELDDQYSALVWTLSIAAFLAVLAAAGGGMLLARRASRPVGVAFDQVRRFAADAAHELKTPLSTIRMRAESSLANGSTPAQDRLALSAIADEGRRLGDVVDRLLFLARSDVQKIKVGEKPVHLDDVMFDALPSAQALADEKGIQIHLAADGNCEVAGDPLLLRHMLGALLENAIKFSPPESEIEVRTGTVDDHVTLSVHDQGPGIPPELQSHIFEPFYRADTSSSGPGGIGLGLSIVRRIVHAHGGRVRVRTPEAGGTSIEASFPRAAVAT